MASTLVKNTRATLDKHVDTKAVEKAARKRAKAGVKAAKRSPVTKAARDLVTSGSRRTRTITYFAIGATTATGAFLFGPGNSRVRRAKLAAALRRHDSSTGDLNDPALARKVESEIFRPADAPKGDVNVDVVGAVVFLRGQVDDEQRIKSLGKAAGKVDGVRGVENLLHTPGTSAPASSTS
jgi:osmotically-inducible protein OsmY